MRCELLCQADPAVAWGAGARQLRGMHLLGKGCASTWDIEQPMEFQCVAILSASVLFLAAAALMCFHQVTRSAPVSSHLSGSHRSHTCRQRSRLLCQRGTSRLASATCASSERECWRERGQVVGLVSQETMASCGISSDGSSSKRWSSSRTWKTCCGNLVTLCLIGGQAPVGRGYLTDRC